MPSPARCHGRLLRVLTFLSQFTFYPVRIADCVFIGEKCIIEAAQIGLGVDIGANCIIVSPQAAGCFRLSMVGAEEQGKFAIIKDLAVIRPGTVLPEGAVVPSLTVWEGNPGTF